MASTSLVLLQTCNSSIRAMFDRLNDLRQSWRIFHRPPGFDSLFEGRPRATGGSNKPHSNNRRGAEVRV
jgi:hypothetical protein